MVLDACPDIIDYARRGIANWRDLEATAAVVRSMLGVSPSAWIEAQAVLGEIPAAVAVAAILQRGGAINSAGGYLRHLTRKAEAGEFSTGPMLMALIGSRKRERRRNEAEKFWPDRRPRAGGARMNLASLSDRHLV